MRPYNPTEFLSKLSANKLPDQSELTVHGIGILVPMPEIADWLSPLDIRFGPVAPCTVAKVMPE